MVRRYISVVSIRSLLMRLRSFPRCTWGDPPGRLWAAPGVASRPFLRIRPTWSDAVSSAEERVGTIGAQMQHEAAVAAGRDQAGGAQDAEMLGDRSRGHV